MKERRWSQGLEQLGGGQESVNLGSGVQTHDSCGGYQHYRSYPKTWKGGEGGGDRRNG